MLEFSLCHLHLRETTIMQKSEYPISWTETLAVLIVKEKSTYLNWMLGTWSELQEIPSFRRLNEKISTWEYCSHQQKFMFETTYNTTEKSYRTPAQVYRFFSQINFIEVKFTY